MWRSWGWLVVLMAPLAFPAGGAGEPVPASAASAASVSRHAPGEDACAGRASLTGPHLRLGRGAAPGGIARCAASAGGPASALPGSPHALVSLPLPDRSSRVVLDRSLRDGTRSARSTGLPPPAV